MDTEYMLIIALIAIVLLVSIFYNVTRKKTTKPRTIQKKYIDKSDIRDLFNRNFNPETPHNTIVNENQSNYRKISNQYYPNMDKISNIIGSRGGNASFRSGRRYEGFDNIDEQSCNENGCNVIENINGIFVSLENKMFPIKGNLSFSRQVNNDTYGVEPDNLNIPNNNLITNDMNGIANANAEMNNLANNVMPYGQGNDLLPFSNGQQDGPPIVGDDIVPIENVNNLLPNDNAIISNNLVTNSNYPQRNYDNSMIIRTPNDVSSNLGIVKKNIHYNNGNDQRQVVEIFRRIG
jgi:hypothetical protein